MMGFLFVLIMIVCVLLILIILIQNPKGGGLSSSFGGSGTQLFGGVKKTTDFLDRGTWGLSIGLLALVLAVNIMIGNGGTVEDQQESLIEGQFNSPPPAATPNNMNLPPQAGEQSGAEEIQIESVPE